MTNYVVINSELYAFSFITKTKSLRKEKMIGRP